MILMGIGDEAGNTLDSQSARRLTSAGRTSRCAGWKCRALTKLTFNDIPDKAFDLAASRLEDAGIAPYCFGSTIMNWAKTIETPWDVTIAEVKRTIPRMQRVGTQFVRIMSLKPRDDEYRIPAEVFRRVREVTMMFVVPADASA